MCAGVLGYTTGEGINEMEMVNSEPKSATIDPEKWLTTGQAAKRCIYSQRGLQAAIDRGDLAAIQMGGWFYIHEDDLTKFLEMMKKKGQTKFDPWASGKRIK